MLFHTTSLFCQIRCHLHSNHGCTHSILVHNTSATHEAFPKDQSHYTNFQVMFSVTCISFGGMSFLTNGLFESKYHSFPFLQKIHSLVPHPLETGQSLLGRRSNERDLVRSVHELGIISTKRKELTT